MCRMNKNAVFTIESRIFLGSFAYSWEQNKFSDITFPAGEKNKDNLVGTATGAILRLIPRLEKS